MYCPRCGENQKNDVKYCSKCGVSLDNGERNYTQEEEREIKVEKIRGTASFIICLIYGIFLNVFGFFLYFRLRKDSQQAAMGMLIGSILSFSLITYFIIKLLLTV